MPPSSYSHQSTKLNSNMINTAFEISGKSQCNNKPLCCSNHHHLDMDEH